MTPRLRQARGRGWFDAVTAPGDDTATQAVAAWDAVRDLVPAGQVVSSVTEYVTPDGLDDLDDVAAARAAAVVTHEPAVSTVVVPRLRDADATVAIEVTTGPEPAATGLVHVGSVLPVDVDGEVVGADDLVLQTAKVYANAAVELARHGLGLEDVVKTVEMVRPHVRATYPKTGFVRKQHLHPPYGGGTGIVQDELVHPDALIQVDFWASRAAREKVDCGWERYGRLTYNPGLRLGDDLFVMSGQAALDVETEEAVLPGDVVAQAEYTYRNIRRVLDHAGLPSSALVRLTEYVRPEGWDDYADVEAVRAEVFGDDLDVAVTTVGCSLLLRPEFLIEVDPWAVLP